jgi:pyruvate formate lyase activating enzyme
MRDNGVNIAGWAKNSFIDFPGTVAAVLFFAGCNLRCPFCHNPDIVHATAESGTVDLDEIRVFLRKRRGLVDGVVFSGGEPTLHAGLADFAAEVKGLGYRVKLDTNGMMPEAVLRCNPDYLALDVKTVPSLYRALVQAPYPDVAARLTASLNVVRSMGEHAEVRITAAPGFVDTRVVEELRDLLRGVRRVYLQPMQQSSPLLDPGFNSRTPIALERLREYCGILAHTVGECSVRGSN